ncbi:hypothetical protein LRS37_12890 [Neobacillus sedimentimangrovi]|uniref:Uncharacterized protein n=1 Tax=Neobacillus sedimentimangrovi TaxID=2699460 RepID=A0ABS8QLQ1_9BACI|nr:hypothetical protein [Neobacillus sedimentimangrovi]MCD4839746.1 hypothetical protein [Neobacillus sedimentimangrovi]
MNHLNEKQMKELFFEGLFTQQVRKYPTERYGKFIDTVIVCTNKSLDMFFNKLYAKYKVKHAYNDFMNECIYWTYFSIQRFTIRDEGSWQEMIKGTDKKNIGRLITNIKTTVENEIIRFVNDGVLYTSVRDEEGKKQHAKYKINFSSLDSILIEGEGEETTLMEMVDNEKGFWGVKEGYTSTHFVKWFKENKERILTKSQVRLLNNLRKCQHEKDGYTENDISQYVGFNSKKVGEYLDRIKVRVIKAWEKEVSMGEKTQLEMAKEYELNLWSELMDIVYQEEVEDMNKAISDWFIANLDEEKVANLVYDQCTAKESKAVTYAYVNKGEQTVIPSKVLYKLVAKVEERLDYLQAMETHSMKFYKKTEEMGRWTPEAHKQYAKYLKDFTQQPCKVYKLNEDGSIGEFLREEKWQPFKQKTTQVQEILPTGIMIDSECSE